MNAVAKDTARYARFSELERAARIRHEMQYETRIRRAGVESVSWRCTHCGVGRITVTGHYNAQGKLLSTSGLCSTPDCLDWGNT
jgi:hypothetical protein